MKLQTNLDKFFYKRVESHARVIKSSEFIKGKNNDVKLNKEIDDDDVSRKDSVYCGETPGCTSEKIISCNADKIDADMYIEDNWREILGDEWYAMLESEIKSDYFQDMWNRLKVMRKKDTVYPCENNVFSAFKYTPLSRVKVVIVGQDPYHQPHQAHGLAFSVLPGIKPPPSLQNMYKELGNKYNHGTLIRWAEQGVFMLNSILTVKRSEPLSHKDIGWYRFTDAVIRVIATEKSNVVFFLWGRYAQNKAKGVDGNRHCILKAGHPSPFSVRYFLGCKHFEKCNEYLLEHDKDEIDWNLPDIV